MLGEASRVGEADPAPLSVGPPPVVVTRGEEVSWAVALLIAAVDTLWVLEPVGATPVKVDGWEGVVPKEGEGMVLKDTLGDRVAENTRLAVICPLVVGIVAVDTGARVDWDTLVWVAAKTLWEDDTEGELDGLSVSGATPLNKSRNKSGRNDIMVRFWALSIREHGAEGWN